VLELHAVELGSQGARPQIVGDRILGLRRARRARPHDDGNPFGSDHVHDGSDLGLDLLHGGQSELVVPRRVRTQVMRNAWEWARDPADDEAATGYEVVADSQSRLVSRREARPRLIGPVPESRDEAQGPEGAMAPI